MKPIPVQMLRHAVTLHVQTAVDAYNDRLEEEVVTLRRVCLQRSSANAISKDNVTENQTATLFVDASLSTPRLDWLGLKARADNAGGLMLVEHDGRAYTVTAVTEYLDDHARLHHWEVALL